jgi:hypothetical protein
MNEWEKIKRTYVQKKEPAVIVSLNKFSFNIVMKKLAELDKYTCVEIYVDDENRRIGFEFKQEFNNAEEDHRILKNKSHTYCINRTIFKKQWISKVTELKGQNVFTAKQEGRRWVITLCPAFENQIKREDIKNISADAFGIYRYLDAERIVYIGKGKIKDRCKSSEREKWKFDIIEYSIIKDDKKALEWENYWIDKYKDENKGQLPTYNLIFGHSLKI